MFLWHHYYIIQFQEKYQDNAERNKSFQLMVLENLIAIKTTTKTSNFSTNTKFKSKCNIDFKIKENYKTYREKIWEKNLSDLRIQTA